MPFLFLFSTGFIFGVTVLAFPSEPSGQPESWFGDAVASWLVLWALIVLAGRVVAVDLEWIEHPRTNTPMTYAGLAAMAVSTPFQAGFEFRLARDPPPRKGSFTLQGMPA